MGMGVVVGFVVVVFLCVIMGFLLWVDVGVLGEWIVFVLGFVIVIMVVVEFVCDVVVFDVVL